DVELSSGLPLGRAPAAGQLPLQRMFAGSVPSPTVPPVIPLLGLDTGSRPVARLLAGPPVLGPPATPPSVGSSAVGADDIPGTWSTTPLPVQRHLPSGSSSTTPPRADHLPTSGASAFPAPGPEQLSGGFTELVLQRQEAADAPAAPPGSGETAGVGGGPVPG